MEFRTELHINQNISANFPQISHKMPILSIGSCFADMIGAKLAFYKFKVISNPFGIIFNPISINKLLKLSLENASNDNLSNNFNNNFDNNFIKNQENIWYHYDFHSDLYGNSKEEIQQKINIKIKEIQDFFSKDLTKNVSKTLILTFGTAFVYEQSQNNEVVANCHKIPQKNFTKKMLSVDEIVADFDEIYPQLSATNTQIVITISPVRHIKDTLTLNSVSKSILRVAAHILSEKYEKIHYFPSFELMNDDLRDYRFYKADMLHPNAQAETYIWEKFVQACMSAPTQAIMQVWEGLYKNISHKNQQENQQEISEKHNQFLQKTLFQLENFVQTLAKDVDFEDEIEKLKKRIK